jgi:hypothetical protein
MKDIDDTAGTAAYIGQPPRTLDQWRYLGRGPRYIKVEGHVRYRRSDVDAWLDANTVDPEEQRS